MLHWPLQTGRRLLAELEAERVAAAHWQHAVLQQCLRAWVQAAALCRQEREAAAARERTWRKVRGWLSEAKPLRVPGLQEP